MANPARNAAQNKYSQQDTINYSFDETFSVNTIENLVYNPDTNALDRMVQPGSAVTSGGLTPYHLTSAATTNATVVKASAGQLYGWYIYNNSTSMRKVAFHNATTTPTAGANIYFTLKIPGGASAGAGANTFSDKGIAFSTGIAFTTVTDLADNGTTAVAANDLDINLFYK